jgi:hypothetical protein
MQPRESKTILRMARHNVFYEYHPVLSAARWGIPSHIPHASTMPSSQQSLRQLRPIASVK